MTNSRHINLDYASGYPVDPEVLSEMSPYFSDIYGNPSALHGLGKKARESIIDSQKRIGKLIGAESSDQEIFFTSGATESNNLAIKGFTFRNKKKGNHIIISTIEHISILNITKYLQRNGFTISRIPVDKFGLINLDKLIESIRNDTILISIMYANNELGTIEPINEIGKITKERKIALHVDGAVSVGKVPMNVVDENIDMLSMSSNDLYGPKGVGGLYIRLGTVIEPIIQGGGQQKGLRSGSENISGIVGFGKAAEISEKRMQKDSKRISGLRDRIVRGILTEIEDSYLHGHPDKRLPDIALLRIFGIEGEAVVTELDREGIYISTGSACASKTLAPSHVLEAIGLNEIQRHGALQFSLSRLNVKEDIDTLLSILPNIVKRLRDISPVWKFKDRFLEMYSNTKEDEHGVPSLN
jgi:cysteine desulfurase